MARIPRLKTLFVLDKSPDSSEEVRRLKDRVMADFTVIGQRPVSFNGSAHPLQRLRPLSELLILFTNY